MSRVRVLLSPGAFAGGVSAVTAARAMASGWHARATDEVMCLPLSDGSRDLVDVVAASLGGELVSVTIPDPLGREVPGTVLHVPGGTGGLGRLGSGTAVVETGQAIGGQLLSREERCVAATTGTSEGVGHLLRAALETGADRIVVGVGPGCVHDGGAGLLRAFGLDGPPLGRGAAALAAVRAADLAGLAGLRAELAGLDLVVACSTDEPLVGLHGAGAGLVGRAGLEPGQAQDVDRAVGRFAEVLGTVTPRRRLLPLLAGPDGGAEGASRARAATRPYSGAGGGVALTLEALGGRLLDGGGAVADLVGLSALVGRADLVVTGCERLDADAVHSGVVATVSAVALRQGIPVVVVAREVEASRRELARVGIVGSYALRTRPGPFSAASDLEPDGASALVDRLAAMSARVARTWSPA